VNIRYRNSQALPKQIRAAVKTLHDDTIRSIYTQKWFPFKGPAVCEVWFNFPGPRGDIDGPLKRTLDALQDGILKVHGPRSFDDGRIWDLHVHKRPTNDWGGRVGVVVELSRWTGSSESVPATAGAQEIA
jgi:Holliday junction resolvase RusA-like endonuclease